ncbi:MAG: histidine kinase [Lachnospiraceae bacterium]|nr:histidine kinase [Lachnospiraceae bacterium]
MRIDIKNMGMRWKILLMTTLILLGFLISQITYFRYIFVSYFNKDTEQQINRIAENVKEDIDALSDQVKLQLDTVYMDSQFMKKLSEKQFDYKDKLYAHDMLTNSSLMSKIYALYIYDNEHNLVSSYRKSSSLKYPFPYDLYGDDSEEEKNLKDYIENENAEFSVLGYTDSQKMNNTIRYVLRLYQNRGNSFIGYIVCDISDKDFEHVIERNLYKDEQHLWLETLNGYSICPNEEDAEIIIGYQESKKEKKQDFHEFIAGKSSYGYQVHIISSVSYLEKNSKEFLRNVIGMIVFLVSLWGGVLVVTSKKMTQQLTLMMQTIKQVEAGDMHIRFSNLYNDELGKLGDQFNHMMDEIENYIYREYQSKIILNDAKYYALQAQINPHFLFNTLNTMASIAAVENCDIVKNMCETLSDIFRYNIAGNMDKKFVTFEEEMTHIKNYLYIVKMRTMDEINFYDRIPQGMEKLEIPKLSLQPLIENSVNHGLKNKRGKKCIWIEAQEDETSLYVSVIDNGIGADVSELNKYLYIDMDESTEEHTSIGLRNINERIHLLFGMEYGLTFEHTDVMKVIVHIPKIREGVKI